MWLRAIRIAEMVSLFLFGSLLLTSGTILRGDEQDRARAFTRDLEFDYLTWMLEAAAVKAQAGASGIPGHLDREAGRIAVSDYLYLTQRIARAEDYLNRVYADPALPDKDAAGSHIRSILPHLYEQERLLAPLAEAVLQAQVADVVSSLGLAPLG